MHSRLASIRECLYELDNAIDGLEGYQQKWFSEWAEDLRACLGWRPIETAPTDRWIQIYVPGFPYFADRPRVAKWYKEEGCFACGRYSILYRGEFAPTHWAPMMEEPEELGK